MLNNYSEVSAKEANPLLSWPPGTVGRRRRLFGDSDSDYLTSHNVAIVCADSHDLAIAVALVRSYFNKFVSLLLDVQAYAQCDLLSHCD